MITPREYLSWSQMNLFERSPEEYKRIYIYGEKGYKSDAIELGKEFAKRMEEQKDGENEEINGIARFFPKSPEREKEIRVDFEGIPLLGKLDGFNKKKLIIREDKTGKKWTQKQADKLGQITFYTILVKAKYGKMPKKIFLDWAETKRRDDGKLEFTGKIKTFETKRTMEDILIFYQRMKKDWEGIQKLCQKEYKKVIK